MPKEKPIIFSTEAVMAILDGRKTQTRRVIKPQPPDFATLQMFGEIPSCFYCADKTQTKIKMPYHVGDTLWVRETWWANKENWRDADTFLHKADFPIDGYSDVSDYKWRRSIHMPRVAARLFLEVTGVRVERVQDITETDAIAEGCGGECDCNRILCETCHNTGWADPPVLDFMWIWDSIYAKRGYSWETNPWVWVIDFKRVDDND
jgi:hypothetical protein